eukprot:15438432-Alexandrium_andersonii.AAC.1
MSTAPNRATQATRIEEEKSDHSGAAELPRYVGERKTRAAAAGQPSYPGRWEKGRQERPLRGSRAAVKKHRPGTSRKHPRVKT